MTQTDDAGTPVEHDDDPQADDEIPFEWPDPQDEPAEEPSHDHVKDD